MRLLIEIFQAQVVQTHRNSRRQNRSELRRNDLRRRSGIKFQMNFNSPSKRSKQVARPANEEDLCHSA
jgi:hypothetical protein